MLRRFYNLSGYSESDCHESEIRNSNIFTNVLENNLLKKKKKKKRKTNIFWILIFP